MPQMMPDQVRKWLRQQSEDFYAVGFDALVKRLDKCIIVGGGYIEKQMLFPGLNITRFTFCIHYRHCIVAPHAFITGLSRQNIIIPSASKQGPSSAHLARYRVKEFS
jgi:hypothetical protein